MATLTVDEAKGRFHPRDVSRRAGLKESIVKKALQKLSQAGVLNAAPGPGGGYRLSRSPARVTLLDIVTAVDGPDPYRRCVLGLPVCEDTSPCSFHEEWGVIKKRVLAALSRKTLGDLLV